MSESTENRNETILQFGRFQFHPYKRQLLQGDRPVRIGSRALDILQVLIRQPGEIIGKDTIIAQVWGNTVVEEINLRVHIAALRRALGEGRTGERYIANVPLRGYGFVGVVETVTAPVQAVALPCEVRASNLPVLLMGLVGRQALLERVVRQLPATRLLTLVGPGGMGKTSLAIHCAESLHKHFSQVRFLDLSIDPDGISLSQNLAVLLREPVQEPTLLLLDNCEHLAERCAEAVEYLLRLHPALSILATSREPLRAEGEHVLRLPPLEVPAQDDAPLALAMCSSAVQLFVMRAREVCDRFELKPGQVRAIIDICRRLDGIPLAIEMAARQVGILGLTGLPALLDTPMQLLMPGRRTAPRGSRACGRPMTGATGCWMLPSNAAFACSRNWTRTSRSTRPWPRSMAIPCAANVHSRRCANWRTSRCCGWSRASAKYATGCPTRRGRICGRSM